jgi:nucleotide-binding universal stress UspA family protein
MLKSILVALDGSASSVEAGLMAIALAKRHGCHVEGLGIVNSAWIQRPEPVPIGGSAYKKALDLKKLETATARVAAVLTSFRSDAQQAHLTAFDAREVDGDPFEQIGREATAHDVIVVGSHSLFDVEGELYGMPACIDRIIRGEPRPVILVPQALNGNLDGDLDAPVLVAFDGSPASSRMLHMLALLGLAESRETHVLSIDSTSETAAVERAAQACDLLRRHGVARVHGIGLGDREAGSPAETILGTAKTLGVGLIAMGAYGHRGIREIFGSCTREVLQDATKTLFLHH